MPGPKVSSAKELPPPIPVRNFRSPKQPTSQDMADLNNFGGGVNPLGYLGHTFTEHGYGPTYSPPVRPPPSAYKQPHRRPQYPSFDFGEDDESTFTAPSPKPPTTSGLPLPPSVTESSPKSCFSLIGPLTPILPECSLSSVGSSTTMSQNIFILWRVFILCMSMAAIIVSIAQNLRYITFLPGVALVFSFLESSIMLRRAVLYRLNHADMYILFNKIKTYGLDALIFQSAAHLCLSVITSLTAVALYGPHMASLIAKAYFKSAGFVIFIVVTICHFLDVAVTPVPFRVLNILPVTWVTLILTIVTAWGVRPGTVALVTMVVTFISLITGLLLHLLGRVLFVTIHQQPLSNANTVSQREERIERIDKA